ncbi:4-(cytidine 5'-diphospho)-2-C-methyl-D-erythritol kinase [Thalassotalea ganghwensis]
MSHFYHFSSPAKLNLFLHIVGRRADGYHELETVFQFLDYGDTLAIAQTNDGQITLLDSIQGVKDSDNLIMKAALKLKSFAPAQCGARIKVKKILPMGGGLGGGSSNAATVLHALNVLWQLNLPIEKLAKIGLSLGADVPIFIHGYAALARGVGEQLTAIEPVEYWYLVTKPPVSISTADVFGAQDLTRNTPKLTSDVVDIENCHNDCQTLVIKHYPEVAKLYSWLIEYAPSQMTGTGACIFSRFSSEKEAKQIQSMLPKHIDSFVAKGINHSPLLKQINEVANANVIKN